MKEVLLCDILALPETERTIRKMYDIGVSRLHESAFAVYGSAGRVAVSGLLTPEMPRAGHNFEEMASLSCTVDTAPLTTKRETEEIRPSWANNKPTYWWGKYAVNPYDHLDEATQQRINRIHANAGFSYSERARAANLLITSVEERARADATTRCDVKMLAHNHPQLPTRITRSQWLIQPSRQDLRTYVHLARYNPGLVEMIVASDGESHHAILYKKAGSDTNPDLYNEESGTKLIKNLEHAGFRALIVKLRDNGSVHTESLPELKAFA